MEFVGVFIIFLLLYAVAYKSYDRTITQLKLREEELYRQLEEK